LPTIAVIGNGCKVGPKKIYMISAGMKESDTYSRLGMCNPHFTNNVFYFLGKLLSLGKTMLKFILLQKLQDIFFTNMKKLDILFLGAYNLHF
jgi:hypothetical protein